MGNAAQPTDAELRVLNALWKRGPSTVRDVYEELYAGSDIGYTTALKLLQNMLAKGLVRRDDRRRQHVYSAVANRQGTLNRVLRDLIERTFQGSSAALAMQALGAKRSNREELAQLKELIRQLEQKEER